MDCQYSSDRSAPCPWELVSKKLEDLAGQFYSWLNSFIGTMICVGLSFAFVDSFSYWQRCFGGMCSYLVLHTSQSRLVCFAGAWHSMMLI